MVAKGQFCLLFVVTLLLVLGLSCVDCAILSSTAVRAHIRSGSLGVSGELCDQPCILDSMRLRGGGMGPSREVKIKAVKKKPKPGGDSESKPSKKEADGLSRAQRRANKESEKNQKQSMARGSGGKDRDGGLHEAEAIIKRLEEQKSASKKSHVSKSRGAFDGFLGDEGDESDENKADVEDSGDGGAMPVMMAKGKSKKARKKQMHAQMQTSTEDEEGEEEEEQEEEESFFVPPPKEKGKAPKKKQAPVQHMHEINDEGGGSDGDEEGDADDKVERLLQDWGLERHIEAFKREMVSFESMLELEDCDLKELGFALGERKAFIRNLKKLPPAGPTAEQSHKSGPEKSKRAGRNKQPEPDGGDDGANKGGKASHGYELGEEEPITADTDADHKIEVAREVGGKKSRAKSKRNAGRNAAGGRAADALLASLVNFSIKDEVSPEEDVKEEGAGEVLGGRGSGGGFVDEDLDGGVQAVEDGEKVGEGGIRKKKQTARERKEEKMKEKWEKEEQKRVSGDVLQAFSLTQGGKDSKEGGTDSLSNDIKIEGFSINVGGKVLFNEANLQISAGQRYGLVGPNGQGKTTLMLHIAKKVLAIPKHIDVLLVEQEAKADDTPAIDMVLGADTRRTELLKLQDELEHALEKGGEQNVEQRLSTVYTELEAMGAAGAEARGRKILFGLGFPLEWQDRPSRSFSGGWRMRISLARALFIEPTLLLLDEPTNHLDLNAVLWLDAYLSKWKKTLMIVSHDVDFLNSVCTDIVHVEDQQLNYYRGNYDRYLEQHSLKTSEKAKAFDKQQKALKALKASGKSTKQADDTLKRKQTRETKDSEVDKSGPMQLLKRPREYEVKFTFPDPPELSPPFLQLNDVSFKYANGPQIFMNIDLGIWMDSRIAIVGPNGCGKSTLLNLLTGDLQPTEGHVHRHQRLRIGRYNQHFVDQLPHDKSAVEHLMSIATQMDNPNMQQQQNCRKQLGRYGLESHAHTIKIRDLSGGQKARVAFAGMAATIPHILLLDEPTNHLDIESIEALSEALRIFKGGVVLVSHDARLIRKAIHAHEQGHLLLVEGGRVQMLEGGMDSYQERVLEEMAEMETQATKAGMRVRLRTTAGAEIFSGARRGGPKVEIENCDMASVDEEEEDGDSAVDGDGIDAGDGEEVCALAEKVRVCKDKKELKDLVRKVIDGALGKIKKDMSVSKEVASARVAKLERLIAVTKEKLS